MYELAPLSSFIEEHGITMTAKPVSNNPNMDSDQKMNHYKVILKTGELGVNYAELRTYFSMGLGLTGAPKVSDVLDSLASDAAGVENARNFEEWCGEYGYESDSRKAEKIYKTCQAQAAQLKQFLGDKAYDNLLWHTERE